MLLEYGALLLIIYVVLLAPVVASIVELWKWKWWVGLIALILTVVWAILMFTFR